MNDSPELRRLRCELELATQRIAVLEESEARYRHLVEDAPDPVVVHVDHKIAYANPASARAFGLASSDQLIGHSILEFAMPNTRKQIEARMASQHTDSLVVVEQGFTRPDGGELHAEVTSVPITYQNQPAMLSVARDITRRVVAERSASAALLKARAQFNGVPVPTYVWQRVERDGATQFVLVDFNDAAVAFSRGITRYLGATAATFFVDSPAVVEELARCLDLGEPITREFDRTLISSGDSKRLFVTYTAAPPDLVIAHTEDVTERRKLEQQFRQAQKMEAVGRLAAGVAHDFNNILSVILSYTEMNLEDLKPGDPLRADLGEIHTAGLRAVDLTRQLLAFSRQQVLRPRVIDLTQTVQGLESMLRRVLGEDIELSLVATTRMCGVNADPGQLEQVLMNLVVNARDAMPTGGKLTIETSIVDGPCVLLAVTDTGVGMDEATRARVFEPFFTTKETNGTGLGLATAFGIVHQSGGTISVHSKAGQGTTFEIRLPLVRGVHDSVRIPIIERSLGGTETILVVEDDESVRVLAGAILRRAGYNVLEAANGGEAFLISEQFPTTIDLVITDVVMPRMNGRCVAERLLTDRAGLKVLYMSGYTDEAVIHQGVVESRVAFIQKPITADGLLRKVRDVLDVRILI